MRLQLEDGASDEPSAIAAFNLLIRQGVIALIGPTLSQQAFAADPIAQRQGVPVVVLTLWLERSKGGQALRAVAEDATTAQLLGINSEAMIRLAFFIIGALAGLGGGLIGVSVSLPGPYFGIGYGLKGLAVLVLGGLGSVPGAIAGAC